MMKYTITGLCLLLTLLLPTSQGANKVIFISFDGFRHDYLDMAKRNGRNISAFEQIRSKGFQAEVQNVMLTLTFPSHYAMATGRNVENHGLVGNDFHDPVTKETYSYKVNSKNAESKWFEYGGAEPLWMNGMVVEVVSFNGSAVRQGFRIKWPSLQRVSTVQSIH